MVAFIYHHQIILIMHSFGSFQKPNNCLLKRWEHSFTNHNLQFAIFVGFSLSPPSSRRWIKLCCCLNLHLKRQHVLSLSKFGEACWQMQPWSYQTHLPKYPNTLIKYKITQLRYSKNNQRKHRKNCECCPVSQLIVRQQRLSLIQVLNCQYYNQFRKVGR